MSILIKGITLEQFYKDLNNVRDMDVGWDVVELPPHGMMEKFLENDGLPVDDFEDACTIAKILLKNGNAVMLTTEEGLFIVNWVWCESGYADRNEVVFRDRASVEVEMLQCIEKDSTELSKSADIQGEINEKRQQMV